MAKVMDMTQDEFESSIARGFANANSMNRGYSAPSSSSGGGSGGSTINNILGATSTGMSNALGATSKFASGLYGFNDALTNVKQLSGVAGPVGRAFGEMGGQVAEAGLTVNKSTFGNSF